MTRLTPDEIAAIQAAPLSEKTTALAKRLGRDRQTVSYQRLVFQRKQGKNANAQHAAQREPKASGKSAPTNGKDYVHHSASASTASADGPTIDWEPEPETNLLRSCTVALDVNEKTLDAWWAAQSLETKAKLFAGNYVIRVEGFVQ